MLRESGLWARLREQAIGPLRDARVVDGNDPGRLVLRHQEAGPAQLGLMLKKGFIASECDSAARDGGIGRHASIFWMTTRPASGWHRETS